ncbi:MAG TPA: hypothetical protein DEO60_06480 [Bacteroidales bacterium]|nr:hypothetical protein [Bacteroidales bacterium]HBZ20752.1 hypothetical protein [Bacteroidales bacterium]
MFPEEFRLNNEARRRCNIRFETDSQFRESIRVYYRLIQGVDDVIGNLTRRIEALGINNTLTV